MTHDELAVDLAASLRTDKRMTWCDMQLGPSGSPRPDVYAIYKSYANPCPVSYECKVSVSDFRADVTTGKWQSYLKYSSAVYFACEAGLISKADVPAHCGLMVRGPGGWRAAKKAVLGSCVIPQDACLKLLIDGVEREGPRYRRKAWQDGAYWDVLRAQHGAAAAKVIANVLRAQSDVESARQTAERIIQDAQYRAGQIKTEATDLMAPIRIQLCEILNLPADSQHWDIKAEVTRIKTALAEHPAQAALRRFTNLVQNALDRHGWKEPIKETEGVQA